MWMPVHRCWVLQVAKCSVWLTHTHTHRDRHSRLMLSGWWDKTDTGSICCHIPPLCPALVLFHYKLCCAHSNYIVRRFYSIANNSLTWLLPLVLEKNQYNFWVQMVNSHRRKCKLQGTCSSPLWCWGECWTLNPQSWRPPWPLHSLCLPLFQFFFLPRADCSNSRVNSVGQGKRVCLFVFLLKAPEWS